MMRKIEVAVLLAGVLLSAGLFAACAGQVSETAEEAEDFPARVETHWTDQYEWFVEHPLLVVGREASFAAHLTLLEGFEPVESGSLTVELLSPDGTTLQRVEADAPARSGIFAPTLIPESAGSGSLRLVYRGPSGEVAEARWTVRIAAAVSDLAEAPPEPEGIGFLKEQQWRIPFSTVTTEVRALNETIDLPATVEPHPRYVAEVSAPAEGILLAAESGLPIPGMRVRAGEVLALVSPPLGSPTGWHTLQAELTEAQNRLAYAENEYGRASRLVEAGAIPARRLQAAEVERDNAAAHLGAIRQQADLFRDLAGAGEHGAQVAPAALPLRAPIGGTVSAVRVTAGEPVGIERHLFRIVDLNHLVVRVEVPESVLQRLLGHAGQGEPLEASIMLPGSIGDADENGWLPLGDLIDLGTEVDPISRTAPVRYLSGDSAAALRPGMAVRTRIRVGGDHEVLAVPERTITNVEGVSVVYVHISGETFEERVIATGMQDSGWVEILSGLSEGERIVADGAYQVRLAGLSPESAPAGHAH